jgi:hypothetical protein
MMLFESIRRATSLRRILDPFPFSLLLGLFSIDPGGGERVRTDGLLRARQALSQLSYTPPSKFAIYYRSLAIEVSTVSFSDSV